MEHAEMTASIAERDVKLTAELQAADAPPVLTREATRWPGSWWEYGRGEPEANTPLALAELEKLRRMRG